MSESTDPVIIAGERLNLMELMNTEPYAIPPRSVDENLILATWNIQHFSEKKSSRSLQYIADIIERFDIIAIQELKSDLRGFKRLMDLLPGHYRFLVSDVSGNTERFAFIYDERTVESTGLVAELTFDLDTLTHTGFQLHRVPYCASFRAGRFDFTVVTVHIFDSSSRFKEKEIRDLVSKIKALARKQQTKVYDRDFFLVGDFNIKKKGDRFYNALEDKKFVIPAQMDNLSTNVLQSGTYDKIVWLNRGDFFFSGNCNVVPFHKCLFQDEDPPGGKSRISDHLPLWAEFKINELTQELTQILTR